MTFPVIPDAAIGAVASATIGGLLAFIGLLVAKENKTSEFRQAWIDALRTDLSKMIASAKVIRGAVSVEFGSPGDLFNATEKHFLDINQAATSIRLRLNPDEEVCRRILEGVSKLEKLMIETKPIDLYACQACETEILSHARALLKQEWIRVRRGEILFVVTKWVGLILILAGGGWLIWTAFSHA